MYKEKENPLKDKSYSFALEIIKISLWLQSEKKEFNLSRQLIRSGTSIGANVEEAIGAQSSKDFLHKISISYKETRETHYWLRLLRDSHLLEKNEADKLILKVEELLKIMTSIQKTLKSKNNNIN